jgi:TonB family protein
MIGSSLLPDLVAYSAQVACVVAIGAALAALIRIDAAGVRYIYWRALLALCLVLPWLQVRRSIVVPMTASPGFASASSPSVPALAAAASMPDAATDWVAFVAGILIAGMVFRLLRVGIGLWRLGRLRQAGRLAPMSAAFDEAQELVRARAEIRYVPSGQPVTFGFRCPVVLLPEMLRTQSEAIQRVVLCHELFHVRRRDWIWVVAEEIVKAALWFHPAVWWLISRVRQAREEVVDELTVLATSERRAYIEALLVFADAPIQAPAAAFARRRHLFQRMVLVSKEAVMSSRRILVSIAAMSAVVATGVWFAVSVFPLTQTVIAQGPGGAPRLAAAAALNQAGPIEQQAKPITPENPIPRRTFSVTPQNPSDDTTGAVIVSVRVVVDRQGRVAEARSGGLGVRGGRGGPFGAPPATPPSDAFMKAAIDAVRQWQYDPPADAPIAFDVSFAFVGGSEPRLVTHGPPAMVASPSLGIAPPSPPPPPPPGWAAGAVRVGGNVSVPTKTKHVNPVYPPIAQSARVQGVVIVELIIGADGHVADARVLRSIPLLDQAAIDAVRQWEFTPIHLNGAAVPAIMTATVQFSLQ